MTTTDQETREDEAPLYCANHPNVETYLRCGKCGKPICAKCRTHTPVGFRCFDCAGLQSVPTHAVDTSVYARAVMMGGAAAAIMGVLMGLFPGFEFWAALIMGIAVPEAISAASNQKRSPGLRYIAIGSILFGFVVSRLVFNAFPFLILMGGINMPAFSGIPQLAGLAFSVTQYTIVWLALAIFLAYRRLQ